MRHSFAGRVVLSFEFLIHASCFCSPFMAASEHRVVTRYLSRLPMAIDTYVEHVHKSL